MNSDIKDIKKRINDRKANENKKKLNDKNFSKLYNFMIKSMVILFVFLAVFTYIKIIPEGVYLSQNIISKQSFTNLINWINDQFYDFFPDTSFINVSSEVEYTFIKDNLYTNNSNEVVNFEKGRVIYKGEQELLGNYLTVLLESNVEVTFGGMTDVFVSEYDLVDQGTVIGTYNDNVIIVFSYNDKEISYNDYKNLVE